MTSRAGVPSFTPILTAATLVLLLATSVVAKEPGRFVPAGRPTPVAPDQGDLPPTVITQSFLDLVDDAEGSDPRPEAISGDNATPPRGPRFAPNPLRSVPSLPPRLPSVKANFSRPLPRRPTPAAPSRLRSPQRLSNFPISRSTTVTNR